MQVAIEIGKYTLESLTSGLYSSPKDLYREYIQNSVDSIDLAVNSGLLPYEKTRIDILIDKYSRKIEIEDNGMGISSNEAFKKLIDIGNSSKTYSVNRGFRGIGRLAGISYCEKLTFITSVKGESNKSILVFDCAKLRKLLIPGQFLEYDLSTVLSEVTTMLVYPEKAKEHYFKVVLEGVEDLDGVLNGSEVRDYLCQVAPAPFNEDRFQWSKEIKDKFRIKGLRISEYNIFLNDSIRTEQLFKVNTDRFLTDKVKRIMDEIKEVEVIDFKDSKGNIQALLWYSISNYSGTILDDSKKGIRLRKGNILIGDKNTLNCIFKEDRFNGWFQGEVYVIDENIIPNARRDNFEKNSAYIEFIAQLSTVGERLSKIIRNVSSERNSKSNKALNEAEGLIQKVNEYLEGGFNSQKEKEILAKELAKSKNEIENLNIQDELNITRKIDLFKQLGILANSVKGATNYKILNLSRKLNNEQKRLLEKVFEAITEICDKSEADKLINEIMKKV